MTLSPEGPWFLWGAAVIKGHSRGSYVYPSAGLFSAHGFAEWTPEISTRDVAECFKVRHTRLNYTFPNGTGTAKTNSHNIYSVADKWSYTRRTGFLRRTASCSLKDPRTARENTVDGLQRADKIDLKAAKAYW